ncbi:ATP-binding cassette domain-containing protein [Methanospirillum hungatei]|uniref:ATP-binding cassette domain-containing protein n=1 Tax=Methanospirillum hungatei TaxID=2203 RepID=UPI0026E936C0|nr:ATP-binding cassette domain-containing protein [Methanospirillum hungatei]MCA1916497.1 ATP-binding cassette domain-containing protein [Methanospirillum hungatei]
MAPTSSDNQSLQEYPLVTHSLTKRFGELLAVDTLTLSVGTEIFGLVGPNGSGKTTTVLMLTTLLDPDSGDATICGYDIRKHPRRVRESISYVPQDMAVDVRLTGRENVIMFAELYGVKNPVERSNEVLKILDLLDRADKRAKVYSGGMRRRLELAQALVHNPKILFLDEPTVGLDVAARKKIWEYIRTLRNDGMTVFVTTHYMDEADRYCDRVAIIDHGRIQAVDTPARLKGMISEDIISVSIAGTFTGIDVPGVKFAHQEEDTLIFHCENGAAALPLVKDALSDAGNQVLSMSVRQPSLDDVFLHLVGPGEDKSPFKSSTFRNMMGKR